jgi:hypothetical protein
VGSKGAGPREYADLWGFSIDKENRRLILNDHVKRRLMIYDADTYEYLFFKNYDTPEFIQAAGMKNIFVHKNSYYFFSSCGFDNSRNDTYVLVADSALNPIFKGYKCQFKRANVSMGINNIYHTQNQIFVYHQLYPYIYKITENECILSKELSFEGFTFSSIDANNNDPNVINNLIQYENKTIVAYAVYELSEIMLVKFGSGMQLYYALYNKKTGESYIFEYREYHDSLGLKTNIPCNISDNEIICWIPASDIDSTSKLRDPAFSGITEEINEEDNPILCFMKWKSN